MTEEETNNAVEVEIIPPTEESKPEETATTEEGEVKPAEDAGESSAPTA